MLEIPENEKDILHNLDQEKNYELWHKENKINFKLGEIWQNKSDVFNAAQWYLIGENYCELDVLMYVGGVKEFFFGRKKFGNEYLFN